MSELESAWWEGLLGIRGTIQFLVILSHLPGFAHPSVISFEMSDAQAPARPGRFAL